MKKCGTKTLLSFLMQHPKIHGPRAEIHWYQTKNKTSYKNGMETFLGNLHRTTDRSNTKAPESPKWVFVISGLVWVTSDRVQIHFSSSRLIAKVDQIFIEEVLENESSGQFSEAKFLENVFVIVSVCDPVHRALSNYLHVTREVKYKTQFTIQEWNQ